MAARSEPTQRRLAPVLRAAGDAEHDPEAPASVGIRPLVLAVDDDPVQRELLWAALRRADFDVVLASDGAEGAALADDLRPDLIVTDALMPASSGLELLSHVRTRGGSTWVPTIVISGSPELTTRLDAFALGADDFMAKPYEPAELVARVRAQLRAAAHLRGSATRPPQPPQPARRVPAAALPEPGTRAELAEAVLASRAAALACATVVLADDHGGVTWLPHRTLTDWTMIHPATGGLGPEQPTIDLQIGARDRCPLCGGAGEGRILLADAGRWHGGAAYLLVGCHSPVRAAHRVLAERLAIRIGTEIDTKIDTEIGAVLDGAIGNVLGDECHDELPRAELAARAWIDHLIDGGEFRFVYQPIVTITTRRAVGYEALVRFDEFEPLDPREVLELATQAGRRVSLELALVRSALAGARVFQPGTWVHVNVSPLAALAPELGEIVASSRQHVVIEIGEQALADADGLANLRASMPPTCRLAIDDVGAGYAGLSRLLDVRPDIVKIDRAVIAGIDADPASQALVAGLVQFGCATDAMVIAEGIETEAERTTLHRLGVRFAQGYLFTR